MGEDTTKNTLEVQFGRHNVGIVDGINDVIVVLQVYGAEPQIIADSVIVSTSNDPLFHSHFVFVCDVDALQKERRQHSTSKLPYKRSWRLLTCSAANKT